MSDAVCQGSGQRPERYVVDTTSGQRFVDAVCPVCSLVMSLTASERMRNELPAHAQLDHPDTR